jgi:hypothetical protein
MTPRPQHAEVGRPTKGMKRRLKRWFRFYVKRNTKKEFKAWQIQF